VEPILPVDNDQVKNKSQQVKVPELEKQLELEQLSEDKKVEDKIFSQANSVVVNESGNFWHQFLKVKTIKLAPSLLGLLVPFGCFRHYCDICFYILSNIVLGVR
jgi:hypothetical protein